jgi:HSP20 family protein
MTLTRYQRPEVYWNPFRQLTNLRDEIDQLFESPLAGYGEMTQPFMSGWMPAVDLFEDKDNFVVKAELPGMKKEDIEVSVHEGVLTISGERKEEKEHKDAESYRSERYFGRFHRTVSLPTAVMAEKVAAHYKDGILTVSLPKAEEAKPKQIPVNVK